MNRIKITLVAVFLVIISMMSGSISAQSSNGALAGSVVDATGAGIPNATVTITDVHTNQTRTVTTSRNGSYRTEELQPSEYTVTVKAPQFSATTISHVMVAASIVTSANATLNAGSESTTVEVSASIAALRTDTAEISDVLSSVEINALPVANLNPYSLALTLPGVTTVTGADFTNGTSFSVNGNRPRDNNFLIEGVDNNDQGLHGQAFQPNNLEAVDQATFLLSSFSAEYGRGGAVSNLVFKSGTNAFHGALYERLLNSSLNGVSHEDTLARQLGKTVHPTITRENLFGFRLGGPIFKDKAFFFVSNQWDRFRGTANLATLLLPTAAGYAKLQTIAATNPRVATLLSTYGTLRGVSTPSVIALGLDPVTKVDRGTVQVGGIQRSIGEITNGRELESSIDANLGSSDKIRMRFIQSPFDAPYDVFNFNGQLPNFDTSQTGTTYNSGVTETHIFSPNILNELRLSWSRIGFSFDLRPETLANPLASLPAIGFDDLTGYGIPAGTVPQGRFQNTYQIEDAFSVNKGSHSLKFGFDIAQERIKDGIPFNFFGSINYSTSKTSSSLTNYTGLANFIDDFSGTDQTANTASIAFGNPTARPMIYTQSYFAQDSWKIRPGLTIDFGLRYEFNGTPFNYLGYPAINVANPAAFQSNLPQLADKNNIAPRFGINYSPDGKTVISAGFGMFYSHIFTNIIDNIQGSSPNTAAKNFVGSTAGRGTPNWSTILNVCSTCSIKTKTPTAADTANVIDQNLRDPETYQYNLRIQRQLPASFVVSTMYVGNKTSHEYATNEFNPFLPSGSRLYPTRGRIILENNAASSNYNSLQAELEHKSSKGLTFRGNYTYSKLMDNGSEVFTSGTTSTYAEIQNPASRSREYSPSVFDHTHRIVVSAVYEVPTWHADGGMRFVAALVNGFAFSTISEFQTGQPLNPEIGFDWNQDGIGNDRPILLNPNAPITNWAIKGEDFFNVPKGTLCDGPRFWATNDDCQVVSPANTHWVTSNFGTTQNTIGRDFLRAGHTSNTDFSLARSFKLIPRYEHQDLQIRLEALNVLNQGNTGNYNTTLISGVPFKGTDSLGNVYTGTTSFGSQNAYLTNAGQRVFRIYARYQF